MPIEHFYYSKRMEDYCFGPNHPLNPERLRRTMRLLPECFDLSPIDPSLAEDADLLRAHDQDYINFVRTAGSVTPEFEEAFSFGLGYGDTPVFPAINEAARSYAAGSAKAARAVCEGAHRAYSIAGGLHHARRRQAAGFCVFNDCSIAASILKEKFGRVAYVDIDVHHGEGVQFEFADDPNVLTCSIHQDGRTIFPGYGAVSEHYSSYTAVNVPLMPEAGSKVWLEAIKRGIIAALETFRPNALVLQHGADPHFNDQLGRLRVTSQDWQEAVRLLHGLNLPSVILGGGGYNLNNVPRMWTAAISIYAELDLPADIPEPLAGEWGISTFDDPVNPYDEHARAAEAEGVLEELERTVLPFVPSR